MIDCLKNINLDCMVEMPGLNARIQSAKGRRDENVKCNHVDEGGLSDSSEPKDNQHYAWIQDLVS